MAVNATAIWRARPSGSNTNGGGYDPGIAGAATDYSQQNAAQATGTLGTASGTTTFTDAGGAFTSAMVGNALWIASGAGFTVGAYFIVTFNSSTSVVLDRSPGTGTVAHWALGGGWADWFTNASTSGPLVPGNIVYALGSGTPNPASYTYDYICAVAINLAVGNAADGNILHANDPATPGYKAPPDTTGGMPCTQFSTGINFTNAQAGLVFSGHFWVGSGLAASGQPFTTGDGTVLYGVVYDQFGIDSFLATKPMTAYGCEFFSSVAPGSAGGNYIFFGNNGLNGTFIVACNFHDCVGTAIYLTSGLPVLIEDTIIAKCVGASNGAISSNTDLTIKNCTIDGNGGHGIEIQSQSGMLKTSILNCIISNHVVAGKSGLIVDAGTAAQNSRSGMLVDFNTYYNNTADVTAINYGPHDTHGGSNPYVGQSTENYSLA